MRLKVPVCYALYDAEFKWPLPKGNLVIVPPKYLPAVAWRRAKSRERIGCRNQKTSPGANALPTSLSDTVIIFDFRRSYCRCLSILQANLSTATARRRLLKTNFTLTSYRLSSAKRPCQSETTDCSPASFSNDGSCRGMAPREVRRRTIRPSTAFWRPRLKFHRQCRRLHVIVSSPQADSSVTGALSKRRQPSFVPRRPQLVVTTPPALVPEAVQRDTSVNTARVRCRSAVPASAL